MQNTPLLSHERPHQTILRNPAKMMAAGGTLLVLDGHCLERPALSPLRQKCLRPGTLLDILLVNPPEPAKLMLGQLPEIMELAGVDYRLTRSEGDLSDQLRHYLHRFKHVSTILINCLDKRDADLMQVLHSLRREGYKIHALHDQHVNTGIAQDFTMITADSPT